MQPWLAEAWVFEDGGRLLTVKLRPGVKLSDGTPLDSRLVTEALAPSKGALTGQLFDDVDSVTRSGPNEIEFRFKRPSMLHVEALEAAITKPATNPASPAIGTGAFIPLAGSSTEFRASSDYYLGKPLIDRIVVSSYPSIRAAWAEALRGNLDVLYEVGTDALDSLEGSTTISTHVVTRRYQHVVVLNARVPALRSAETRRELNRAIDREVFVKRALSGYGVPSIGPIWPHYWALPHEQTKHSATPPEPSRTKVRFTCLVVPDAIDERMALELKRQFSVLGIEMNTESVSQEEIHKRMAAGEYDAALLELISGPTFLRPYSVWLTHGPINVGGFGNATVDAALERARNAETEQSFQQAVTGVQQAFQDDPPAIFLAWNQRARAISNRFVVPPPDPGRDILSTLRLWKQADAVKASRN